MSAAEFTADNFLGLTPNLSSYQNAKFVVLPLPFDGTSTYMKGADRGPKALIKASQQVELFDIESQAEPCKAGIFTASPVSAPNGAEFNLEAERRVAKYLNDGKFVLCLGGEHSVTLGPVKAHASRHKNLSVLQLDAHTDLRAEFHGDPLNHACIMARCLEVTPTVVQVGIRSMDSSEVERNKTDNIFYAEKIAATEDDWVEQVVSRLTDEVYLTIDLDVLDPSIMPSTGTPEPGGLGWYDVLRLVRRVAQSRKIVGADIVELCPRPGVEGPDFVAAKLAYKVISYVTG